MKRNSGISIGLRIALVCLLAAGSLAAQSAEDVKMMLGKSVVIDYPEDIARISTSTPDVVDAVPATTREILLHGKALGGATVVVWAKSGQRTFYNVTVEQNLEPLRRLLKQTFPNEDITVQGMKDSISLSGRVSSQAVADRAALLSAPMAKSVVNNLSVAVSSGEKQIVLRVKFAEVNRIAISQLGVNILSTGAGGTIGRITTGQFNSVTADELKGAIGAPLQGAGSRFLLTDLLNVFAFRPDLNLTAFVKALQSEGVLQILAEPNLVTTNGKEASFLVGGEFPIPVLQGGANAGAVTIQFREFGIRLTFNPVITDSKSIKMQVRPEVSTIDLANAVTFNGFTIPALSTRRVETNVELAEGQSFIIGGLIDDRVNSTMQKIPGLANIPVLGQLFKSRSEKKDKTELVVMVSPEITMPLNVNDPKPVPVMPREFLPSLTPTNPHGTTSLKNGKPAGKPALAAQRKK